MPRKRVNAKHVDPVIPAAPASGALPYEIRKHGRFWAVRDAAKALVCVTVYKRGAVEVVRRLGGQPTLAG